LTRESGQVIQPGSRAVFARPDEPECAIEHAEAVALGRPEPMLPEERHDARFQVFHASHAVPIQVFPMVVMAPVDEDPAAPEEPLKDLQGRQALGPLRHDELRKHLPSETGRGIAEKAQAETALAVDEPRHPSLGPRPFLLIACTHAL
jgi:hypothetical protein